MDERPKKSKKPSATKAESLLESTTFFIDRCLGRRVGEALRNAGFKIELHENHFSDNTFDEVWIPKVSAMGWVILTKDKQIRRKPAERHALITSRARVFTLPKGSFTSEQMVRIFLNNRLKMGRHLKNNAPPFAARVSNSGVDSIDLGGHRA